MEHLVSLEIFVDIDTEPDLPAPNLMDLLPPVLKLTAIVCVELPLFVTRTFTTHSPFEFAVTLPGALTKNNGTYRKIMLVSKIKNLLC